VELVGELLEELALEVDEEPLLAGHPLFLGHPRELALLRLAVDVGVVERIRLGDRDVVLEAGARRSRRRPS
jgi:hypothetical protein